MGGEREIGYLAIAGVLLLPLLVYLCMRRSTRKYAIPALVIGAVAGVSESFVSSSLGEGARAFLFGFALGAIVVGAATLLVAGIMWAKRRAQ